MVSRSDLHVALCLALTRVVEFSRLADGQTTRADDQYLFHVGLLELGEHLGRDAARELARAVERRTVLARGIVTHGGRSDGLPPLRGREGARCEAAGCARGGGGGARRDAQPGEADRAVHDGGGDGEEGGRRELERVSRPRSRHGPCASLGLRFEQVVKR